MLRKDRLESPVWMRDQVEKHSPDRGGRKGKRRLSLTLTEFGKDRVPVVIALNMSLHPIG